MKNTQDNGTDWIKEECQKGISDLYQLDELLVSENSKQFRKDKDCDIIKNRKRVLSEPVEENPLEEQCLLEYLLNHHLSLGTGGKDCENSLKSLSYDDLLASFKDLNGSEQLKLLKTSSLPLSEWGAKNVIGRRSQLSVLPEENSGSSPMQSKNNSKKRILSIDNKGSCEELPRRGRKHIPLKSRPESTPSIAKSQMENLCTLLNNLLIVKADESGYESDSTRAGSDSPRGSIKSTASDIIPQRTVTRTDTDSSFNIEKEANYNKKENDITNSNVCCAERNETRCDDAKIISGKILSESDEYDDVFYSKDDVNNKKTEGDINSTNETDEEKLSFSRKRNAKINLGIRRGDVKSLGGYRKHSLNSHSEESAEKEGCGDSTEMQLQTICCNKYKSLVNDIKTQDELQPMSSTRTHLNPRFINNRNHQTVRPEDKEFKSMRFSKDHTGELGVYIERKDPSARSSCYVISYIEPGGVMHR